MAKTKELQELGQWKVEQYVTIHSTYSKSIRPITKITNGRNGTIYVGDEKFDGRGHLRGGSGFHSKYITITADSDRIEIRGNNAMRRLSNVRWNKLGPKTAIKIETLLNNNGIDTRK